MAALCFKYLKIAIQVHRDKVADSPIVADIGISLIGAGVALQEIIPLVLKKSTQHTQHCPTKKHDAENKP